jgi:hypothetical protein
MPDEFESVPRSAIPEDDGTRPGRASEASKKLEAGEVLFFPNADQKIASRYRNKGGYLRKRGLSVMARRGEFKGTRGIFVWVEKPESK